MGPAFAAEGQYQMKKDYPADAKQMLDNMRTATELTRGAPGMEETVKKTRSEMNDFVAFYRRQPKVAGMPSFSTLYTAINTLSGHYASYGNKYPVPTKRKERLTQQYKEIDRALARGKRAAALQVLCACGACVCLARCGNGAAAVHYR